MELMDIGCKIKSYRVLKNLSPEQVAERLEISSKTYRKYEANQNSPNLYTLEKLAKIVNKSIFDLLPESIFQNNEDPDRHNTFYLASNELSGKVVALYEARLQEKDNEINFLRQILKEKILTNIFILHWFVEFTYF